MTRHGAVRPQDLVQRLHLAVRGGHTPARGPDQYPEDIAAIVDAVSAELAVGVDVARPTELGLIAAETFVDLPVAAALRSSAVPRRLL